MINITAIKGVVASENLVLRKMEFSIHKFVVYFTIWAKYNDKNKMPIKLVAYDENAQDIAKNLEKGDTIIIRGFRKPFKSLKNEELIEVKDAINKYIIYKKKYMYEFIEEKINENWKDK